MSRRRPLPEIIGQPTRLALIDLARRAPGTSLVRVADVLGLDYSTVQYHARVLERHGAAQTLHLAGSLRLYPPGAVPSSEERARLDALACGTAREVANAVLARGESTLREVMMALDLPRSTAQEHLKRLARVGVLVARPARVGPTVYAAPAPDVAPPAPGESPVPEFWAG